MPHQHIPTVEVFDGNEQQDCGLGHACNFCPKEQECQLDKTEHNTVLIRERLAQVQWIILVMANKGGVGKSTVSANLSVALANNGFRVGLADADIHGPNAPRIFGLQNKRMKVTKAGIDVGEYTSEHIKHPVAIGSLGFLLPDQDTPVVWRDAYKHDYIHHMIGSFNWGTLDYLVVDMPPGTGNELITLTDLLEGTNMRGLLVSPADGVALQDTLKMSRFCKERGVPILGLAENYAGTICPHCGGEIDLFPRAPEIEQFEQQGIKTLTRLPFSADIAKGAAAGVPATTVPDSLMSQLFDDIVAACKKEAELEQQNMVKGSLVDSLQQELYSGDLAPGQAEMLKQLLAQEQQRIKDSLS